MDCVSECALWACTRVCSRARVRVRVGVCCAGAAERAYPRRKRPARSRAAEQRTTAVGRPRAPRDLGPPRRCATACVQTTEPCTVLRARGPRAHRVMRVHCSQKFTFATTPY